MTETATAPPRTIEETVEEWLAAFNDALARGDADAASQLFLEQLKARAEGIDTPVYGLHEVHHLS